MQDKINISHQAKNPCPTNKIYRKEINQDEVKKYLSDMDSKSSPFYYNATLTIAQKYLAEGNRDVANKYLDKIVNDKDAPASILGVATTLR